MCLIHPHSWCHRHEWITLVDLEELCHPLFQDSGGEWTKWLSVLHARIDVILHRCVPGVRQNGPISEGARTDLGPALEPADDFAGGQITGYLRS